MGDLQCPSYNELLAIESKIAIKRVTAELLFVPTRFLRLIAQNSDLDLPVKLTAMSFSPGKAAIQNHYYPILDAFLVELKQRLNVSIMKAIQACNPESPCFLEPDQLQPLADHYDLDYSALEVEAKLAKRTLTGTSVGMVSYRVCVSMDNRT